MFILVRPESYINDVINITLIDNKANVKGTCNKDDINILVRACVRVPACVHVRARAPVLPVWGVRVFMCARVRV